MTTYPIERPVMTEALQRARLYGILDLGYVDFADAVSMAELMLEGGVQALQLRAKGYDVSTLRALGLNVQLCCREYDVPFIVNDHPALARDTGAAGVHVGQLDHAVLMARAKAKVVNMLVGKSTHSLEQAAEAEADGADYIGFGPLFATPTKPDYTPIGLEHIRQVHERVKIPIFCIGGIKRENVETVLAAGAKRVVIVSGILKAPDVPAYCRDVRARLDEVPL